MFFPKKNDCKFCLVGSGKVLASFAKLLVDSGYNKPTIVTWKNSLHDRDRILLKDNENYVDIFEFSKLNQVELIEVNNINDSDTISKLKERNINLIFSISSRWIISKTFIDAFKGAVLNIHAGYLPKERGSVVYPKILNNINSAGVTIHLIEPKIDAGPILLKKQLDITIEKPSISEFTKINNEISVDLLKKFLSKISDNFEFKELKQDVSEGFYMPQLYTELNGFIDWSWEAKHIESFIRAFGPPMLGSATFYNGTKIRILEAFIEKNSEEIHPLFYGRIVNITEEGYAKIATKKNIIVVTKIMKDKELLPNEILKISNILYTPIDILENARIKTIHSLDMEKPKL